MPAVVHKNVSSGDHTAALRTVSTFLAQPTKVSIDDQARASEIIKLQTYLSTVSAGGQPSGFKFDPAKINKTIDDQALAGKIVEVENAANAT